jgi:predicted RNA-binding protein
LPSSWVASITPENWEILKKLNIWGLDSETIADRIGVGDRIVLYVTRTQPPSFMGIYEITGKWQKATEPVWADEKSAGEIIYQYRTSIKPLRVGSASVRELKERLGFIANKRNYQVCLIGSPANMKRS